MKNMKSVVRVMYERTLSYNRPRPPSKPRAPRPANNNAVLAIVCCTCLACPPWASGPFGWKPTHGPGHSRPCFEIAFILLGFSTLVLPTINQRQ